MAKNDVFIINGPPPASRIDKRTFGVKTTVLKRSGRIKNKYTIEVKADPLAVRGSAFQLSEPLARALIESISDRIRQAGRNYDASPSTIAKRKAWGSSPSSPSALFRFRSPRRKDGIIKKNAMPDSPPDPDATGLFNHSGRLREGLRALRNRTRFSTSKNQDVWTIFVAANRLHEPSFGPRFFEFLDDFKNKVQPNKAVDSLQYKTALSLVSSSIVKRLSAEIKMKRAFIRRARVKSAGRLISYTLGV